MMPLAKKKFKTAPPPKKLCFHGVCTGDCNPFTSNEFPVPSSQAEMLRRLAAAKFKLHLMTASTDITGTTWLWDYSVYHLKLSSCNLNEELKQQKLWKPFIYRRCFRGMLSAGIDINADKSLLSEPLIAS